ncbi:MAG TPA: Na+/H+ antiporter subunit A [Actinomycetaceae bacterium]|nr:Na+/H+ antiporter subunit A [Actinomycetaceae bacterium]
MLALVLLHGIVAIIAPVLLGRLGRRAFLLLALVPAGSAVWLLFQASEVYSEGAIDEVYRWVGQLGLHLDFRLDALSWVMALIVTGVGSLVLVYCAAYFSKTAKALGRFGGVFVAFAGSMLGLVLSDNILLMYVFWELTTVTSFILIGHYHERQASRRAASQAILVTTFGGLAMLAGIIGLASMPGGSFQFSVLVARAAEGGVGQGVHPAVVPTFLVLILLGAFSKSALVPFHFWLPAAMAAPTPVSAYLHAAAMVKAGVYLVARMAPGFAGDVTWHTLTLVVGLTTMILGGYRALRQHDLKLLLAFGTVSQLGMLIAVLGYGTAATALAGLALLVGHSLFKSTLFLTVGVIDWSVGTRDFRQLSGLGRRMPVAATAAAIATASMVGLPPMAGFVAKEAALAAGVEAGDWPAVAVFAIGSILTFAYGMRFWFGAFWDREGVEQSEPRYRSRLILTPIVILSIFTVAIGVYPVALDHSALPYARLFEGEPGHLALWHGFTLPLAITGVVVVGGLALFLIRDRLENFQGRFTIPSADNAYRSTLRHLTNFSADVTALGQRGSLPFYLMVILGLTIVSAGGAAVVFGTLPEEPRIYAWWGQVPIAIVAGISAWLAARARRRLKAVVLAGVSGYAVALLYAVHGGPDIALTQVLVETVTLVIFVLVLRRLPTYFTNRPFTRDRWVRVLIATLTGAGIALMAFIAGGSRIFDPVSIDYPEGTLEFGYGRNIVNVTLVDTRAWDTMGEISVILVAATGVASLLFVRDRFGMVDSARNRLPRDKAVQVWSEQDGFDFTEKESEVDVAGVTGPAPWIRAPHRGQRWLPGGATLAPRRRSLIFEVGTRLIFPSMIVFSLYLLFAGHNQPGGGFAGGLMAGTALTVRYLAAGRYELGETMPIHAGYLLGGGLVVAAAAALAPLLFGGQVLQTMVVDLTLPIYGDVHIASALFFDTGVYLIVIGLVLDLLRSFGAEIDRHGELEGIEDDDDEEEDATDFATARGGGSR